MENSEIGLAAASPARRALVVDDSLAFRLLARSLLGKRRFNVDEAVDAEDALIKLGGEIYDLIFLDIKMPGMQGTELCRMIRRQLGLREVPIIAYTADGMGSTPEAMGEYGFDGLLIKPVNFLSLDRVLSQLFSDYQPVEG